MDGCEFVTSTNIWLYDRSRSNVLWLTFSRTRQCPPGHQDRQLTLVPSGWQSLARCVASARSDIRRPPVGQPLALFFTIALPFAGTGVASEVADEPRLGGQLRASHPAALCGARVEALADEARRVEPSADAQRRKRARVSGRPRPCLASSLWSSVRSEPSPARITAGGARAARAARGVTGGSRRHSRAGTSRELWGRAGVRALGVSFDGATELGAAAAATPAVTSLTLLKAAAGWPNCVLLFSAVRARRELGLQLLARAGLLWEHSRAAGGGWRGRLRIRRGKCTAQPRTPMGTGTRRARVANE